MSDKSKCILLFTTAFKPFVGGSEIAIEQVARRLPDIFFDILTPKQRKDLKRKENLGNITVYRVGLGYKFFDKIIFPITGFLKAAALNRKFKYKICHAFQASQGAGAAWLFKTFFRPRFILTLQEGKDLDRQNYFIRLARKMIIRKADAITAISNYLKNYAEKINPKADTVVIPNGVDMDYFSKIFSNDLKEKLNLAAGEKVFISVSRLVPKNGISDLIEAFAKLIKQGMNARLLILGSGPLESRLKLQIKNLGLKDKVFMTGNVAYKDIPEYLKTADIFVRPSLSEGLGNSFLEAMAAGLPVIGTPVGGIVDFIKDEETGIFCQIGNSDDLARKMRMLAGDPVLCEKLKENGKKLVAEKYNWDNVAEEYRGIYEEFN